MAKPGLTLAVAYAFLATLFFTIIAFFTRYLDIKAGIPGALCAFVYLFFEGCIGTIALIAYSLMGHGVFDFKMEDLVWVTCGGVLVTLGLVLQNYSL